MRYRRLTRARGRRWLLPRVSLWLGPDHLLSVESTGYWEDYKRFYFRDIQAVIIRGTKRRTVWNAVLTGPLVIFLAGLLASATPRSHSLTAIITWSILSALVVVPFALNNILGPACATQLRTAVQTEDLPSLCRLRQTRRILERIRPLIVQAQGGEVPPPGVSGPPSPPAATVAAAPPPEGAASSPAQP
jgi:hypothetical protein